MKITYEFDTDKDNYDMQELTRVQKAFDMAYALWDIDEAIRKWYKYDEREAIPVDEIRETFVDILQNHYIDLEEVFS